MKKLRLIAVRSQKEELLRELIRLGCVEIRQPSADTALAREGSGELARRRAEHTRLLAALRLLDRFAPEKKGLLTATPEVEEETLLDESVLESDLAAADRILELDETARRLAAEESREYAQLESLAPWENQETPLEKTGTETCSYLYGTLPSAVPEEVAAEALSAAAENAELFFCSEDKVCKYYTLLVRKEEEEAAVTALRELGWGAVSLGGFTGTARDNIVEGKKRIAALSEERAKLLEELSKQGGVRRALELGSDVLAARIAREESAERLLRTESTVTFEGWLSAPEEEKLEKVLEKFDCAWETEDPAEDEYPEVPVQLRNNKFTNALNMVTNMYSLPAYGTVDPNPLMAPFFIAIFGLMMADVGYGLIMIAAAIVALKKMKPREGNLAFMQLLLYGGIATTICGVLTGGFFSDVINQIYAIKHPETPELIRGLFSAEKDSTMVLFGSMGIGLLHLNTGMAVNFSQKLKRGEVASAVFEEGSLWVMLVGGVLMGLPMLGVVESALMGTIGKVILIIGTVMLLFGAGRESKGFGKVTAAFGCIYNTATGWFGDILSYSRIMALMLAGGVVGKVFNTVALMPSKNGFTVGSTIAFVVIFLIGHVLNFALNLLGCYVHDLRLQCLEFFGKFYTDGGKAFDPLRFKGDFVRAKDK